MNSFYGVMGAPACRFFNPVLPISITATGQWVLRTAREYLERQDYRVLYGDTDSLFVQLLPGDIAAPHAAGERLAASVNAFLAEKLQREFHVASALDLEFQRYCRRFYLPSMRNVHPAHADDAAPPRLQPPRRRGQAVCRAGGETGRTDRTARHRA